MAVLQQHVCPHMHSANSRANIGLYCAVRVAKMRHLERQVACKYAKRLNGRVGLLSWEDCLADNCMGFPPPPTPFCLPFSYFLQCFISSATGIVFNENRSFSSTCTASKSQYLFSSLSSTWPHYARQYACVRGARRRCRAPPEVPDAIFSVFLGPDILHHQNSVLFTECFAY